MGDLPAAGWYPDPEDATQQRYWDGQQWTEHRAPLAGQPQPQAWGQPTYGASQNPAANVDTWLWQSIVATVLCCLPAGVVAIVFAAQANQAKNTGDVGTAQAKARLARIWTLVSIGVGVVVIVGFFALIVIGAVESSTTSF